MYDKTCLDNTKQAWLDIEETLQSNPSGDQAIACLKRIQHLLNQCINQDTLLKSNDYNKVAQEK